MRCLICLTAAAILAAGSLSPASSEVLYAAGFSFSDELGGIGLREVSGTGRPDDPIVIVEDIHDLETVALVVRPLDPASLSRLGEPFLNLAVRIVATNRTGRVWAGFNLELRESLLEPSDYFDGLSFWQMSEPGDRFRADRFARVKRRAEPSDLVQFRIGSVDPNDLLTLDFQISDTSPAPTFYLLQEPEFLVAERR